MPEQKSLFPEMLSEDDVLNDEQAVPKKKDKRVSFKRRKKANRTVEDYYVLLDVTPEAIIADVKRGYLQKLRQYPPEMHPVEFERIRNAYDTLRDDNLRKEYDIVRQYGESIDDLLQEAVGKSITAQSVKLLERATTIDPLHMRAGLALAFAYIFRDNEAEFHGQFYKLKQQFAPEKHLFIFTSKIKQLLEVGRVEGALEELEKLTKIQPDGMQEIWPVYVDVYEALGLEQKLLREMEVRIQALQVPKPEDARWYAVWLYVADAIDEKEKAVDKISKITKKWMKNFRDEAELLFIAECFFKEYQKCYNGNNYHGALAFIELAMMADRKHPQWRQYAQECQDIVQIMREMDRIFCDERLFPPVVIDLLQWLNEEFYIFKEEFEEMKGCMPPDFIQSLPDVDEIYATGIILLKKRYPVLYRHYQTKLDNLFKEKTAGLNREERRSLRLC